MLWRKLWSLYLLVEMSRSTKTELFEESASDALSNQSGMLGPAYGFEPRVRAEFSQYVLNVIAYGHAADVQLRSYADGGRPFRKKADYLYLSFR